MAIVVIFLSANIFITTQFSIFRIFFYHLRDINKYIIHSLNWYPEENYARQKLIVITIILI